MDRTQRAVLRELCLRSFYHFVELIIMHGVRNDKNHPRFPLQPFHKTVLEFCQDDTIQRKLILMPRYFLKSTCITCSKPIWDWLRNPEVKSMIVTETAKKAAESMNFIKGQLERNELLRYIYPELVVSDKWKRDHTWSGEALIFPSKYATKDPSMQVMGVGNAAQGSHVDYLYLDDIIGQADKFSLTEAQNTKNWFDNVEELLITPDISKPHASLLYLIGTHYAPGDIYDKVKQSKELGYKWITVPAEDEFGEPTWPEKLSKKEIERFKSDPARSIIYYTQMQNNPMASGLTAFQHEWLENRKYVFGMNEDEERLVIWTDLENKIQQCRVKDLDITATIDPSSVTENIKQGCRTAVVIVGQHRKSNAKFVLEAWARKISEPRHLYEKVFEFRTKYRPRKWGIETFAQQSWVKKILKDAARDENIHLPLIDLPKDTGKDAKIKRIESLAEEFATGQIYIREDQRDLIGEYHSFPMGLMDILDALAYHKHYWRNVSTEDVEADRQRQDMNWRLASQSLTGYGGGY